MVERLEGLEGLNMLREAFRQVCLPSAEEVACLLVDVDVLKAEQFGRDGAPAWRIFEGWCRGSMYHDMGSVTQAL